MFGWLSLLMSSPKTLPQVFVLEYAIDHPGDMAVLCNIVQPSIGVMTRISPVHAEHFRSVEQLTEEKAQLLECIPEHGLVVLNADDPRVMGLTGHVRAPVMTYGFSSSADVQAVDYGIWTREDFSFEPGELFSRLSFGVIQKDGRMDVELKNMLGRSVVSSVLCGIAVARHFEVSDDQILRGLQKIQFEPGRMNPIPGIKGSLILDSSYNAAPASTIAALEVLSEFHPTEAARRFAVLGDMAELGQYSENEHRMVGLKVAEIGADMLITVGAKSLDIQHGAIEAGMSESQMEHFSDAVEAGRWLDMHLKTGDVVLIKGSQSIRMERTVKDLMAEPMRAAELLIRQETSWTTH